MNDEFHDPHAPEGEGGPRTPLDSQGRPTHGSDGVPITPAVRQEVARQQAPLKTALRMDEFEGDQKILSNPSQTLDTPSGWLLRDDVRTTNRVLDLWGHTPGVQQARPKKNPNDPFAGLPQSIVGQGIWQEHQLSLRFQIPEKIMVRPHKGFPVTFSFDPAHIAANQVPFQRHLKLTHDPTIYVLNGRAAPEPRAPEPVWAPDMDSIMDILTERVRIPVMQNQQFDVVLFHDVASLLATARNKIMGYTRSLSRSLGDLAGILGLWYEFAFGQQMTFEQAHAASQGMIQIYDTSAKRTLASPDRPSS